MCFFWILGLSYSPVTPRPFSISFLTLFFFYILFTFTIPPRNIHDPWCHFFYFDPRYLFRLSPFFFFTFCNPSSPPPLLFSHMSILASLFFSFLFTVSGSPPWCINIAHCHTSSQFRVCIFHTPYSFVH